MSDHQENPDRTKALRIVCDLPPGSYVETASSPDGSLRLTVEMRGQYRLEVTEAPSTHQEEEDKKFWIRYTVSPNVLPEEWARIWFLDQAAAFRWIEAYRPWKWMVVPPPERTDTSPSPPSATLS